MALADAPSAAIAIRNSNRRTNSSSTKMAPAIGALNAVARPAPAPAASNTRQSGQSRRKVLPTRWPKVAAMCTLGPSRPSASPAPIASAPPMNFTGMTRNGACGNCSLRTASTCGMPLPAAWGEIRRTSEAAIPAAAPQAATNSQTPSGPCACAKTRSASRNRSACSSRSMKQATPAPEIAPTTSARTVRSARLPPSPSPSPPPLNSEIIRRRRFRLPDGESEL